MREGTWKIWLMVLLILTATLTTTANIQPAESSKSSLVGYWNFNEGTGTIAHDSSGNNNHGTIEGGSPMWVHGISEWALHFDGDDDNVMVPDSSSLHITDPLTIDFWFKPDVEVYAGFEEAYILVGKWHGQPLSPQWRTGFLVNLNVNSHPGDGKMRFWLGFGNGEMEILASTRNVWHAGVWYHITATYDRSLPSGNAKLYINGTLDSQLDAHKAIAANTLSLYFNFYLDEQWHPYNTYFPGIIDEVRINGTYTEATAYDVIVKAHCNTEDEDISVGITMDDLLTGYNTPHTFTGLTGTHTFTVPNKDPSDHPFKKWNTGETSTTIPVSSGGTYTAYYQIPRVGGIVIPVDKFALLAPYIGLTSTIAMAAVATAVYVKRVKRRKEKQ